MDHYLGLFIRAVFIENMALAFFLGYFYRSLKKDIYRPRAWNRRDCRFSDHGSTQ